jgi:rRNA maturation endonuclease Nob1
MNSQTLKSHYVTTCIACGAEIKTAEPETVCAKCGIQIRIEWQAREARDDQKR